MRKLGFSKKSIYSKQIYSIFFQFILYSVHWNLWKLQCLCWQVSYLPNLTKREKHVLFHRLQLRSPLKHRQSSLAWNLHSNPCCGQPFTAISQVNIADVPCLTTMAITSLVSSLYRQGAPITPGSHQDYINGIRDSLEVATPHYKTVKIFKVFTELIKHMKVTFWYYMNDRGCTQQTLQARALSDFHDSLTQLQLGTKKCS